MRCVALIALAAATLLGPVPLAAIADGLTTDPSRSGPVARIIGLDLALPGTNAEADSGAPTEGSSEHPRTNWGGTPISQPGLIVASGSRWISLLRSSGWLDVGARGYEYDGHGFAGEESSHSFAYRRFALPGAEATPIRPLVDRSRRFTPATRRSCPPRSVAAGEDDMRPADRLAA